MIKKLLVAAALLGAGSSASAAVYNDVVSGGSSGTTITAGTDFSFTHNILDDGFNPATMTIDAAQIILALSDPARGNEQVQVQIDLGSFVDVVTNVPNGSSSQSYTLGNAEFNLISNLQSDGLLSVVLRLLSQGGGGGTANVTFNSSTLNVSTADAPAPVPEPAMLGLLGLGVLGLAAGRRRKAA